MALHKCCSWAKLIGISLIIFIPENKNKFKNYSLEIVIINRWVFIWISARFHHLRTFYISSWRQSRGNTASFCSAAARQRQMWLNLHVNVKTVETRKETGVKFPLVRSAEQSNRSNWWANLSLTLHDANPDIAQPGVSSPSIPFSNADLDTQSRLISQWATGDGR